MKRVAFYRRGGKEGTFTGLRERLAWHLSKGPATGRQICEAMGFKLAEFNAAIASKNLLKQKTACITASEWFVDEDGFRDRIYTLEGKPRRVVPEGGKTVIYSIKSLRHSSQENRKRNTERAERRARLIKAGLYIDEFN